MKKNIIVVVLLSTISVMNTAKADIYTYDFTATVTDTNYYGSSFNKGEIVYGSFSYQSSALQVVDQVGAGTLQTSTTPYDLKSFIPNTGYAALTLPSASNPGDAWSYTDAEAGDTGGGWNFIGPNGWVTGLIFHSNYNTVSEQGAWSSISISLNSTVDYNAVDRANWVNGALPALSIFNDGGVVSFTSSNDGYTASINSLSLVSVSTVPVSSAVWLFGSALAGLSFMKKRKIY